MNLLSSAPGVKSVEPIPDSTPVIYDPILVHAACGLYVGAPKWRKHTDWVKEPDECQWEEVIQVERDEWENEEVNIRCSKCGGELDQSMGHFEELEEQ